MLPLAATALLVGVVVLPRLAEKPRVEWTTRHGARHVEQLGTIEANTELSVQLELQEAAHVWLLALAPTRGAFALHPSGWLHAAGTNPLAAGRHTLRARPPDVAGPMTFALLVSREERVEIAAFCAGIDQLGDAAFADRSLGFYAPKARTAKAPLPELVRAAGQLACESASGPLVHWPDEDGVWVQALHVTIASASESRPTPR